MANSTTTPAEEVDYSDTCDIEEFDISTVTGAILILIFVVSVMGNSLLLCVMVIYEDLKNITNMFVLNLACSDLLFTATLPFWATYHLHHWVFGYFLCKVIIAMGLVGLYSSIILLTAMTVDRFITVVLHKWPSKNLWRKRGVAGACAAAWLLSVAVSLYHALRAQVHNWQDKFYCELDRVDFELGFYLEVSLLFFLPFAIIVFCYSAILKTILQTSNRKRHRTVVLVLCIVAAFFFCWGPFNFLILIILLYKPTDCKAEEQLIIAFHICRALAYSHCCMNPLLYMLAQKLRGHLLHLFQCECFSE
uniref:G-protein coupled receptors family 1 profile domain-containing protein n=1 Tax=Stegastes partitus TaxID=144197 RepID=A0A3B4Z120_9TELE